MGHVPSRVYVFMCVWVCVFVWWFQTVAFDITYACMQWCWVSENQSLTTIIQHFHTFNKLGLVMYSQTPNLVNSAQQTDMYIFYFKRKMFTPVKPHYHTYLTSSIFLAKCNALHFVICYRRACLCMCCVCVCVCVYVCVSVRACVCRLCGR